MKLYAPHSPRCPPRRRYSKRLLPRRRAGRGPRATLSIRSSIELHHSFTTLSSRRTGTPRAVPTLASTSSIRTMKLCSAPSPKASSTSAACTTRPCAGSCLARGAAGRTDCSNACDCMASFEKSRAVQVPADPIRQTSDYHRFQGPRTGHHPPTRLRAGCIMQHFSTRFCAESQWRGTNGARRAYAAATPSARDDAL